VLLFDSITIELFVVRSTWTEVERAHVRLSHSHFARSPGAHERILNTPTYTAFTRQTSRFLILWLTFLPFSLSAYLSWACCGCMPVLCFLLAGIDNIASSCENPVGIDLDRRALALCAPRLTLTRTTRSFVRQMTSLPIRAIAASNASVVEVVRRTKQGMDTTLKTGGLLY